MPLPLNLVGQTLGQYELRGLHLTSPLTQTYLAFQPYLQRSVALQTLAPHVRDDELHRRAFVQGAQLLASFEHPHIALLLDAGEQQGIVYAVKPFLTGGSLLEKLDRENGAPQPFPLVSQVIRQIGSALDYVHAAGKVHGDPATRNILLDGWQNAYVADFFLAGFVQQQAQGLKGVPLYMAPERWREEAPTPFTDQYALAAIAYHLLCGRPPYEGEHLVQVMQGHIAKEPWLPQQHRPEIPLGVNEVLWKALAKNPAERYATVVDFAREFDKALQQPPAHLFISYSRRDTDYARRLQQHLRDNGFPVWMDAAIEHGDHWFNEIHEAIQQCGAFLVIMSPASEKSEWVQKEILLAKRYQKPIFPLLLAGEEFPLLIDLQYADVRGEHLPDAAFQRRIRRVIYGEGG